MSTYNEDARSKHTYVDLVERHAQHLSEALLCVGVGFALLLELCLEDVMLFLSEAWLHIASEMSELVEGGWVMLRFEMFGSLAPQGVGMKVLWALQVILVGQAGVVAVLHLGTGTTLLGLKGYRCFVCISGFQLNCLFVCEIGPGGFLCSGGGKAGLAEPG